jgi:hypothetical protein
MKRLSLTALVLSAGFLTAGKLDKLPQPPAAWDKFGINLGYSGNYFRDIPERQDMCLSITSYWVWNKDGEMLDGWGNQCNEDCSITASGTTLPAVSSDYSGGYAACVQDWTSLVGYPTKTLDIDGYGKYTCVDTFGEPSYRKPFFHEGYDRWVIPVDLLHPGAQDLVCDWSGGWTTP